VADGIDLCWRLLWRAAAGALLLAATSAAAATPPAPASPSSQKEVVVTGQAPKAVRERQLQAFVKRVPALNNGQALARWVTPVCPLVAGMTQEQGEYVLVRLIQVARAAGAPVIDDGNCTANVYIVATANPEGMVKAMVRRSPSIFARGGVEELRRFEQTPRPVRVWYNAELDRLTTSSDSPFEGMGLPKNIPVIHHAVPSRLVSNSPYALVSAIIVVDSARVAGTKVGAVADYLAMTALAQLRPDSDGGDAPSILNLFTSPQGSQPPDGLTAWDAAFLNALYHTSLEDLQQASAIAAHMDRELSRGER